MNNKLLIPASIVLAGLIIAVAVVYSTGSASLEKSANSDLGQEQADSGRSAPTIDDDVVLGDVDAPITLIEFGDFECPFCKQLHDQTMKRIRDEYVSTGKVRMVYRDFPLSFHPSAVPAAEAAECAKEQGGFWNYHDALFENQASLAQLDYVELAGKLGLDKEEFRSCYESRRYKEEVEKDLRDGIAAGVQGTPATFINGVLVSGAVPYETFKGAIEAALGAL